MESNGCRVTKLVMETGLSYRQVYYQLGVLRNIGYIYTAYQDRRYIIRFAATWYETGDPIYAWIKEISKQVNESRKRPARHLRVER